MVLFGLLLMTGCKKDPIAPTLTLTTEPHITEGMEVETGTDIKFNFDCKGENLSSLLITITGENGESIIYNFHDLNGVASVTKTEECIFTYVGRLTLEATLRANGKEVAVTLHFKSVGLPEPNPNPAPDPHPEPVSFDGSYKGFTKIEGNVSTLGISYPVNDSSQVEMEINVLENNQVEGIYVYHDIKYDFKGRIEKNRIAFNPFTLEIATSDIQLVATIELKGTLDKNVLSIEGDLSDCTFNYNGASIPVSFVGEINGTLEKAR